MSELNEQSRYWDSQVEDFDSIYSSRKSGLAKALDTIFRWDMFARFEYTMEKSKPIENRTFLDVGCGTGKYSLEFARRGCRRVVGIDIAANMIEVCKERADKEGLADRCEFIHADLLAYNPEERFDVCIGIGLFDYIRHPHPVVARMRECITDRAIMSFPRLWTWRAPIRKIRLGLNKCGVFFYTKNRIAKLLEESNFARYEIDVIGQLYCVTAFAD